MNRIFIDGQAGTTGLQIHERLSTRTDIALIEIDPAERKNPDAKQSIIDQADVVVLCLPDDAARETVRKTKNTHTRFIDASTAHRVNPDWTYGMPELMPDQREAIASARLVSNPGCYPTGFLAAVKPLISASVLARDALISISAISGYSGGGRQLIEKYESAGANWCRYLYTGTNWLTLIPLKMSISSLVNTMQPSPASMSCHLTTMWN